MARMSTPPAQTRAQAPGATAALVLGVVGICLPFLGPFAIWQARNAQNAIAASPQLNGGGMAVAGLILGILATLWLIILVVSVAVGGNVSFVVGSSEILAN